MSSSSSSSSSKTASSSSASELSCLKAQRCHGGWVRKYSHRSGASLSGAVMRFTLYVPDSAVIAAAAAASTSSSKGETKSGGGGAGGMPALWCLAGLTCNEDTFLFKAQGVLEAASKHALCLVAPDTSPRATQKTKDASAAAEGKEDGGDAKRDKLAFVAGQDTDWDFGSAASFYVDCDTKASAYAQWQMYTYLTVELRALLVRELGIAAHRQSITGHSMGGFGALLLYLKSDGLFQSCSAFAPMCSPQSCAWG
jgi:S-formylglutathione hydrolase